MYKYPLRATDVAYRIIDGEAILVGAKKGRIYSLNTVGSRIWEMVDGKVNVSEIIANICQIFEVEEEQARKDSLEFLQALIDREILVLSDGSKEE